MRRYSEFLAETAPAAPKITPPNNLAADLGKLVDDFVGQLKQQLIQGWTNPQAQRGVWDRMKGWWSNLWHGRYNQNNPYYWKNKLGDDLGRTVENTLPMPLDHFKILHEQATLLELSLPPGTEKLQLVRVIDNWSKQFKNAVVGLAMQHQQPVGAVPETPPEVPAEKPVPAEAPPAEKTEEPHDELSDWRDVSMARLERIKDKLSPGRYENLKKHIQDGDQKIVDGFLSYIERHGSKDDEGGEAKPEAPKDLPPRTAPMKIDDDGKPKAPDKGFTPPPSAEGKRWAEIDPHQQVEWDKWGGGDAGDVTPLAKKAGIETLPWILRIGDPRLKEIQHLYGKVLYRRMVRQKRIESVTEPINSYDDLMKAVGIAQKLREEERQRDSERNKGTADRRRLKTNITDRLSGGEDGEEDTGVAPGTPLTPGFAADPKDGPAPVPDEGPVHPRVAAKGTKVKIGSPELTGEKPEGGKPPRVAPMKLPGVGEKSEDDADNKVKLEKMKADLESIQPDIEIEVHQKLAKLIARLEGGATPEQMARAEKVLKDAQEEAARNREAGSGYDGSGGGLDDFPECTVAERTAFVLGNFRVLTAR